MAYLDGNKPSGASKEVCHGDHGGHGRCMIMSGCIGRGVKWWKGKGAGWPDAHGLGDTVLHDSLFVETR